MKSSPIHIFLFLSVVVLDLADAQSSSPRFWVMFREKDRHLTTSDPGVATALGISNRALWRRGKVLPPTRLIDQRDLPVSQQNIDRIAGTGSRILGVSRWLNAVAVEANDIQRAQISGLPMVRAVQPVSRISRPRVEIAPVTPSMSLQKSHGSVALDYGPSFTQLANIKVVDLHSLGISGDGVIIGMIDNGFNNHRSHSALGGIQILDEYDFIHRIRSTQRQPWEGASQGNHGQYTLSAIGGFDEGSLIGAAYGATFILAKTEMDSTEVPQEEILYVEALEWMEQLGADVVSTSLGYIDWYTYDSLDGRTAITSKAARIAASKGVLLVTANGNEGHFRAPGQTGTLIAPADSDSIIAAGATYSDYLIAEFSSTGPTFDGRVKPDLVAQGVSVVSASGPTSAIVGVSGTSLSTPLIAGSAALVFSAHPGLTPMQVREAIIQTSFKYADSFDPSRTASYPNNFYGFGVVNALSAALYYGPAFSNQPRVTLVDTTVIAKISIAARSGLIPDSLFVFYRFGPSGTFTRARLTATTAPNEFEALIPRGFPGSLAGYFSATENNGTTRTHPYGAPDSLFVFSPMIPTTLVLYPNFPNPFNNGTSIRFDVPSSGTIELAVYNLLGQKVKTVFHGFSAAGTFTRSWDGTDDGNKPVSSGVYFSRITTTDGAITGRMMLLR